MKPAAVAAPRLAASSFAVADPELAALAAAATSSETAPARSEYGPSRNRPQVATPIEAISGELTPACASPSVQTRRSDSDVVITGARRPGPRRSEIRPVTTDPTIPA